MQQVPFFTRLKCCTVLGFGLRDLLLRRHANRLALTAGRPSAASGYSAPGQGTSDPACVLMYMALLRNTQESYAAALGLLVLGKEFTHMGQPLPSCFHCCRKVSAAGVVA